jgi:RNA methyltransferase, TrmH family
VESLSKNKIKWIRSLRLKKNRDKASLFIVEGEKMVNEIIREWGAQIELLCVSDENVNYSGEIYLVNEKIMKEISLHKTPGRSLAVVKKPTFDDKESSFILAVDGIQDPGNLGTIIRTADWFGIHEIVCSIDTVDVFNPKVIQSSMGSIFRMKLSYLELSDYLQNVKLPIYGALLEGDNVYEKSFERNGVIVVGNEGQGISEKIKPFIQNTIYIPNFGNAESLNVSIATGIILSEFSRKN